MSAVVGLLIVAAIWLALVRIHDLHHRLRIAEFRLTATLSEHTYLNKDFERLQEDNENLEYELRLMEGERIYYSWVNTLLLFGMQRQYAVMKSLLRRM